MLVDFEPRTLLPLHAHRSDHVYVLARGAYSATVDGAAPVRCRPGAIVFRPARLPHWDQIDSEGCTDLRLELPPACRAWLPVQPGYCFSEMLSERSAKWVGQQSLLERAQAYVELFNFLWDVRRLMLGSDAPTWMRPFIDLLFAFAHDEQHSGVPMTPERIARRIGISRSTLQVWAHRRCGMAVGRLMRQTRALSAAQRIVGTTDKLAGIAFDVGFADQPHLTRELKQWLGITPAQLRSNDGEQRRDQSGEIEPISFQFAPGQG